MIEKDNQRRYSEKRALFTDVAAAQANSARQHVQVKHSMRIGPLFSTLLPGCSGTWVVQPLSIVVDVIRVATSRAHPAY